MSSPGLSPIGWQSAESPAALADLSSKWVSGGRQLDADELVAIAEHVAPLQRDGVMGQSAHGDAVAVLVEWADGDRELIGRAWQRALLRNQGGDVRHRTVELLWDAARQGPGAAR